MEQHYFFMREDVSKLKQIDLGIAKVMFQRAGGGTEKKVPVIYCERSHCPAQQYFSK